jgi:hypothetical protein
MDLQRPPENDQTRAQNIDMRQLIAVVVTTSFSYHDADENIPQYIRETVPAELKDHGILAVHVGKQGFCVKTNTPFGDQKRLAWVVLMYSGQWINGEHSHFLS